MPEQSAIHDTFVIERSYPLLPDRVFSALADAAKKRRWFAESDSHQVEEFGMEFRVGGIERFRYRFNAGTPFAGIAVSNEGTIQDIVPNKRVVTASAMTLGERRISVSLVTIELRPEDQGTRLVCTHQGVFFEGADGPQMRKGGWVHLLDQLAKYA
jgi:uncharacterized protein YndB with AHSA1/START domain